MKWAKTGLYLLLVIMITFVMISPSAATEGLYYENEATVLNDLGLYKGTSTTTFDPDLGANLTRETGIVMLLRLFGLEDEALAMTDAQANTVLLKFTDAAGISSWAKKPLAYAVKNELVLGNSNGTVASQDNLNGKAYCTMILRQLGYTPNYDLAPNELVDAGGLTTTEAAKFISKPLKKDDLVGISYGTLSAKDIKGEPVLVKLIANKVVDPSAALDSGLSVTQAARVASEAVSAYEAAPIITLAQITVAEKLGTVASDLVELIKDAGTKVELEARIKTQTEKVAIAKKKLQEPKPATATFTLTIEPKSDEYIPISSSHSHSHSHSTPSISGTVAITGTGKYGSVLTADPSALTNAGTPTYQWKRDGIAIGGATASTYTLAAADIGAVITVTATADGAAGTGSITSAQTAMIAKADGPAAPAAPTEASKTDTSITLVANALNQFSKDGGVTWQDSETFTGLTASTAYTFVARVKETATTNASVASGGTSITTAALYVVVSTVEVTCPSPSIGQSGADAIVNAAAEYTHTSTVWSGRSGDNYIAGETPVVVITLTAKAGRKFTGLPPAGIKIFDGTATLTGTVTYEGGQGVQGVETSVVFTVTYPQL